MRRRGPRFVVLGLLVALMAVVVAATAAQADPPPAGSDWSETYINEPDGTRLHADVLRPNEENAFPLPAALAHCG